MVAVTDQPVATVVPALYETTITHVRQTPFRHAFTYTSYCWLVDLDHLPRYGPLARFRAADHIGTGHSLRQNIDHLLASEGLTAHRVLMLSNARSFGHVFNPISVHWCFDEAGGVLAVVAEVHNTYQGRHAYVLRVDDRMCATADKVFYVSPFHPVEGRYEMRLPVPDEELLIDVIYRRADSKPFAATVRGSRTPVSKRSVVAMSIRHPLSTRMVSVRIRLQGIGLYLRKLPVIARIHPESS